MSCQISIPCYDFLNQFETTCTSITVVNEGTLGHTIFVTAFISGLFINPTDIVDVCQEDYQMCDYITSVTMPCIAQVYDYPLVINAFVYYDSINNLFATVPTPGYDLVGFTLETLTGDPVIYGFTEDSCVAEICITQKQVNFNEDIQNFKLKVLYLQEKYTNLVVKYTQKLKFGLDCSEDFRNLRLLKRGLYVLNRYDVRDILEETPKYNLFTFQQMTDLLNKIY